MAEVTTLADLPNEILSSSIFPFLQHDTSTILNLALVSQRFKDLAQTILFKTITPRLRGPTKGSHDRDAGSIHIFDALVSTLKAHPHLRAYILSLSLSVFHHPYYERFCSHSSLLSLTPNLRTLSFSPPPSTLALTPSDHPHLHSLAFNFGRPYDEIRDNELEAQSPNSKLALVSRHFFLPSLRTYHIDGFHFWPRDLGPALSPAERHGRSQIESLELFSCSNGDIGILPEMLKCIKVLQRFVFETRVSWESSHMGTPSLTAQSILVELKPFQQELRQLCIAASDGADFARGSVNRLTVNGSEKGIREFVNLRVLAVPEFFLVSDRDSSTDLVVPLTEEEATESVGRFADCLPESIEYLQIQYMHGFQQEEDPHREVRIRRLDELARRKGVEGASFMKLKRVVWWMQMAECWSGSEYGEIEGLVALKKTFENVGVDFEWVSEPYWEYTPFGERKFDWEPQLFAPKPQFPVTSIKGLSIH